MKSQNISFKNFKMKPEIILGLVALAILLFAFYNYSSKNNTVLSPMSSYSSVNNTSNIQNQNNNTPQIPNQPSQPSQLVREKPINNPVELLPSNSASEWAKMNPIGANSLSGINLLSSQQQNGINTQGSSLRNANLQIRSEPANPRNNTNCPWNVSTIDGDTMRRPLEIGSQA